MSQTDDIHGSSRVLLIEDNDELRTLLGRVLNAEGFTVEMVANGDRALELLRGGRFDLVVTDLIVPGREGIEIILSARALAPHAGIVAMSGGALDGGRDYLPLAGKLGAAEVLRKPFGRDEFLAAVSRVLGTAAG